MDESTKYTFEHIGDIVVEKIEQLGGWVAQATKGISLTYRIHCLEKKKNKAYGYIGYQTVKLRKRYPLSEVFIDENMRKLLTNFDKIDTDLSRYLDEREDRLYPRRRMATQSV